jgi:hypothetical protein
MAFLALPSDDAVAQSRVKIKPFTNMYYVHKETAAGADIDVLATPAADLMGFKVLVWSDTTAGDTVNLVIYHNDGADSTALLFYPKGDVSTIYEFDFSNCRTDGFRVDMDPTGAVTAPLNLIIYGWY